jgi:NAD(P)H-flavin reductase/ferredoxin
VSQNVLPIRFGGHSYEAREGESVLACLLRYAVQVDHSCRQGACQSCLMKVSEGQPPPAAQAGLKQAWRSQGYVLACMTPAKAGLVLERVDAAPLVDACIERAERLSGSVLRVWLRGPAGFCWQAGQFVHLRRSDGLTRSYSVASLGSQGLLELHVALRAGGRMSGWLAAGCASAQVQLRGPFGECFYLPGEPERKLILAGTGTGLAPLFGVLRTALDAGHSGPIWLYHGSRTASGLYLWDELTALAARHPNLHVVGCAGDNDLGLAGVRAERVDELMLREHPRLADARLYLCGNPDLVGRMKKRAYLAGAALDSIHADPFVEAPQGAQ